MSTETITNLITQIGTDLTNAYTALEDKEVTIPSVKNLNNLVTPLSNIELGIPKPRAGTIRNKIVDGDFKERKYFWNYNYHATLVYKNNYCRYTMLDTGTEGYIYPIWTKVAISLTQGHVYAMGMEYRNTAEYPDIEVGMRVKAADSSVSSYVKQFTLPAVGTEWQTLVGSFTATETVSVIAGLFTKEMTGGQTFDVKRIFLIDLTEEFATDSYTPNYSRIYSKMVPLIQERYIPNVKTNTPTGSYASSTYYHSCGGAYMGYGKVLFTMVSGTSTAYENIYFAAGTLPDGVTIENQSHYTYTSNSAGSVFCCILDGITEDCLIDIELSAINSTSDYVTAKITVTFAE